ncbi:odorant receptor 30a-like [Diabrotica virgifera virgifera]|uniref:Odorant receptor n=1 Tax=Diabrotica virgifera virgifera TaxID=50390 RepID=A0ABM5K0D3_DIAVI|nr:odorant receptor 30a-like [Diabrotica virgifera virgifera]
MDTEDHIHMKFIKPFLAIAGIWPLDIKGFKLLMYNFYFYATFTYYVLNVSTIYVTAKQVASHGTPTEITNYISNAVFSTLLIYKALTYRSSGIKDLLNLIKRVEADIVNEEDEEIKTIYMKNVKASEYFGKVYVYQAIVSTFCAQLFPLISTLMSKPNEEGYKEKYYIVANWEPFDKYEYYGVAYLVQLAFTIYAEMYIIFCGTFLLFIMDNIVGRIFVLQYKFSKCFDNAQVLCETHGMSFKDACNILVTGCIREHQQIIWFMNNMDNTFKRYIFVEYICTSFGLSVVVLQFLLEESIQMKIAAAGFFIVFASQSLIIYYHADIVAFEGSHGLVKAIFSSNWHILDVSAQKLLKFVILRAQKPLTLSIGPFRKVGVESMIALFKATYSYLSVMWK